jgi:DNA-binding XRE family transcriptional regulator
MVPREHASPVEDRTRSRRQAVGLSQQELASRGWMTWQAMNAIEAGHHVTSTLVAIRVAEALGCRVEYLLLTEAGRTQRPRHPAGVLERPCRPGDARRCGESPVRGRA